MLQKIENLHDEWPLASDGEMGHLLAGKEVEMPIHKIDRISFNASTVFVNWTVKSIEQSPVPHLALNGAAA
jgi:hypothetical protein